MQGWSRYNLAAPLLGTPSKSPWHRNTCTWMLTAALATTAKTGERRSLTDEGTEEMWCTDTVEFHSSIKMREIVSFAGKRSIHGTETKYARLKDEGYYTICRKKNYRWNGNKICQTQILHVFPYIWTLD